MRQKVQENTDSTHSTPDIYSTPILSERPSSTTSRSINHADSFHQIVLTNKKPISSIPSDLQLQSHGTLTTIESNDSCIFTQTNSEQALSEIASNKNSSELNGNSIASSFAADKTSLQSSSTTHVKTKKPKFKLFDKRKLSYLSFRKNKTKKSE